MPTVTYNYQLTSSSAYINSNNAGFDEGNGAGDNISIARIGSGRWFSVYDEGFGIYGNIRNSGSSTDVFQSAGGVRLNTTDGSAQFDAEVTGLANGSAVMVFVDTSPGAGSHTIRARLFDASGAAISVNASTNDFEISVGYGGDQSNPDVVALADGGFVVTWVDNDGVGDNDIIARAFNADGTARSGYLTVRSTGGSATDAHVAALTGGDFVVAWTELNGADSEVWFQRYTATGVLVGSATLVDTTGSVNDQVDIVGLQNGGFACAYRDNGWGSTEITLARYNSAGAFQGFTQVNAGDTAGEQGNPTISLLSNGYIAVGYDRDTSAVVGSRTMDIGIFDPANGARVWNFVSDGGFPSGWGSGDQLGIAGLANGRLATVWRDPVSPGGGGAGTDVRAASFDLVRTITGDGTNESLVGDDLKDIANGLGGSDLIFTLGGDDTINGGAGGDFIDGGAGADQIDGGADFDVASYLSATTFVDIILTNQVSNAFAAAGDVISNVEAFYLTNFADLFVNDGTGRYVYAYGGSDTITGGAGSDYVDGGAGADSMNLGGGFDYVSYNSSGSGVTVNLLNTALNTGDAGGDSYSSVDAFVFSENNDTFTGAAGQNFAFGYGGADILVAGAASNDWFFGGNGNDYLYGGALADLLTGEAGADIYAYNAPSEGGDSILSFTTGEDKFYMQGAAFGFTAGASLSGANFISGAAPVSSTSGPTFLYYSGSGFLYYDADGTGAGGPVAIAQILGAPVVSAGDFVFI